MLFFSHPKHCWVGFKLQTVPNSYAPVHLTWALLETLVAASCNEMYQYGCTAIWGLTDT